MPSRISERDSTALYFIKCAAILATLAGHLVGEVPDHGLYIFASRVWNMFSTICVSSFLMVSGILYTRSPGDSGVFWKKKLKYMILPWLFCSILTCTVRGVLGHPSDFVGYIRWILGMDSLYYYVTVYLVLMAFFKLIGDNVPALWCCVAVTALTLLLRAFYIRTPLDAILQSEYLNPLYWVGFFSLGILLRKKELRLSKWTTAACFVIYPISAVYLYRNYRYDYFHIMNAVHTVTLFVVMLNLGRKMAGTKLAAVVKWIGSSTYCIYLLHLQIATFVYLKFPEGAIRYLFLPVIVLIVMLVLIEIGKWITRYLPFGDKIRILVGLR